MIDDNARLTLLNITKRILSDTFSNKHKLNVIGEKTSSFTISCPVCGDSKNSFKKRGNLYLDTMKYHCFNGGCSAKYWDVTKFIKHFDYKINDRDLLKNIYTIQLDTNSRKTKNFSQSSEYFKYLNDNSIDIKKIVNHYNLKKETSWSNQFLIDRLLTTFKSEFYYKTYKGNRQVWIFNKIYDKVIGLQIRNLDDGPKYLSKPFSKLYKELDLTLSDEKDNEFLDHCDTLSLIFNIFSINLSLPFYILEGPIDSFFCRNSIATAGASKLSNFFNDIENAMYIYDNDDTGKKKALEKCKHKCKVFMWKKFLNEMKLKDDLVDVNDCVKYAYKHKIKTLSFKNINNYFTKNKLQFYYV